MRLRSQTLVGIAMATALALVVAHPGFAGDAVGSPKHPAVGSWLVTIQMFDGPIVYCVAGVTSDGRFIFSRDTDDFLPGGFARESVAMGEWKKSGPNGAYGRAVALGFDSGIAAGPGEPWGYLLFSISGEVSEDGMTMSGDIGADLYWLGDNPMDPDVLPFMSFPPYSFSAVKITAE